MPDFPPRLSVKQAARRLGLSVWTVRRYSCHRASPLRRIYLNRFHYDIALASVEKYEAELTLRNSVPA